MKPIQAILKAEDCHKSNMVALDVQDTQYVHEFGTAGRLERWPSLPSCCSRQRLTVLGANTFSKGHEVNHSQRYPYIILLERSGNGMCRRFS